MKIYFVFILIFLTASCIQPDENSKGSGGEEFKTFEKEIHFRPDIERITFDTTRGWDFGWTLIAPIYETKGDADETGFLRRLSPGQKSLYFIWRLDLQVTNGGFIQFYWNDFGKYIPAIKNGLILMGDTAMLAVVNTADSSFMLYENEFRLNKQKQDWEPLYDSLSVFDVLDSMYYSRHDRTMEKIEQYAREHPGEFLNFK